MKFENKKLLLSLPITSVTGEFVRAKRHSGNWNFKEELLALSLFFLSICKYFKTKKGNSPARL